MVGNLGGGRVLYLEELGSYTSKFAGYLYVWFALSRDLGWAPGDLVAY